MKLIQKAPEYQICRVCGYDRNQNNAVYCETCKFLLKRQTILCAIANVPTGVLNSRSLLAATALSIGLLATGCYLIWNLIKQDNTVHSYAGSKQQLLADNPDLQSRYFSMQEVPNVPTGIFNYGGATCFAAMTAHGMNTRISNAYPQFHLRYTEPLYQPPGCSTGIEMLLSGELSFAQNGRPLSASEYSVAKKRNFYLVQVPVAIDGIVFFTHPALNVSKLSVAQLQDIYMGKIKNWKQLGGQDLPIVLISQDPKVHNTLKLLMGNQIQNISSNVLIVRDYTSAIRSVASTVGAISYSSAAIARGQKTIHSLALAKSNSKHYVSPFTSSNQVNVAALQDGTYPLTRRLFVVIRRDGTLDQKAGIAYANMLSSVEGQRIIEKAGFAAIYSK